MNEEVMFQSVEIKAHEEAIKKGKKMLLIVVIMDIVLSVFSSAINAWTEIMRTRMLEQSISDQYGGITVNAGSGNGPIILGAMVGIGVTALLAYHLYRGSGTARVIRIVFAGIGLVIGVLQLVSGIVIPMLLITGLIVLVMNGFVLYALLGSKNVKAVFGK